MRTKISKSVMLLCMVIASTTTKAQQFQSFQNIEKFLSLTPKELESKLIEYGYSYDSKHTGKEMTTKTFINKNLELTANYGYDENQIVMFMWNDKINKAKHIVENIEDNPNYRIVESKTNDGLGVFYLESKTSDLDIIIFKTIPNAQKGVIGFNLFRNKEKI